jgi:hypothetical protein
MMVSLMSLWLPILLGAVFVFLVSSVIHMALGYHWNDYGQVPKQDDVQAALRPFNIPPGDYMLPKPATPKDMTSPEFQDKWNKGPKVVMTVFPAGPATMGKQLVQWFVYCLIVGLFAAYIASRTLAPGTEYLQVFRVTGCVAFVGYGLALLQSSIWYSRRWSTTLVSVGDALVYGLVTGGAFGWLWPM